MTEELKPCPVCRSGSDYLTMPTSVCDGIEYVVCQSCGARTCAETWGALPRTPEGYALVPVEPTEAMKDAVCDLIVQTQAHPAYPTPFQFYRAMIAAAQEEGK